MLLASVEAPNPRTRSVPDAVEAVRRYQQRRPVRADTCGRFGSVAVGVMCRRRVDALRSVAPGPALDLGCRRGASCLPTASPDGVVARCVREPGGASCTAAVRLLASRLVAELSVVMAVRDGGAEMAVQLEA